MTLSTVEESIEQAFVDVSLELSEAMSLFPKFHSAHEAYAVIAEELDEVWDCVKANKAGTSSIDGWEVMRKELVQLAAMTMRAIVDLRDRESWSNARKMEALRKGAPIGP